MSDLGYRNKNQAGVYVSVNSLEEYVRDLSRLISAPHPEYEAQGVVVDGEWRQLNANLLQIENEYYSFIRPKRVAFSGERPTKALLRAGVQYVEMRSLDVGAYDPVGVNQSKLLFLEAFAALCLLRESPPLSHEMSDKYEANHVLVAGRGREPGLTLWTEQGTLALTDWAAEIIDQMQGICELLDAGERIEALLRGARVPAREARGFRRAALGAPARGDAPPAALVLRGRALDVGDASRLFPRALPAESGAARGTARGGCAFARGATRGRGARCDAVRRVRGALYCRIAGLRRGAAT